MFNLEKSVARAFLLAVMLVLVLPFNMRAETIRSGKIRQADIVSINFTDTKLRDVLKELQSQTDFTFVYNNSLVNVNQLVSINEQNARLDDVLDKLFLPLEIEYEVVESQIIVSPKKTIEDRQVSHDEVKGIVLDQAGIPVPGVTVLVKGTKNVAVTDSDGRFQFKSLSKDAKLVFSSIGFREKEISLNGASNISVSLEEEAETLENVVITGFQNIKKSNFTGSSVKVNSENLELKGTSDLSRMLEGKVAGVSIQNVSGTFGAAPKVRVRGATSINGENKPLWVIDGVVQEDVVNISNDQLTSGDPSTLLGSSVAGLNSNDIESIDVLKDASATALYGARAMNGVIVVTTKRGKQGRPIVNYTGNFSMQLKPTYGSYDIMNSMDQMSVYAELERKGYLDAGIVNWSSSGIYGKMYNLINEYNESDGKFGLENTVEARRNFLMKYAQKNTDWFDVLFRNSLIQEHSLSISAGGEKSRTYASVSYLNDEGWTVGDNVNRYTANVRNDYNVYDALKIGLQVVGSVRQQKAPGSLSRRSNTVEGSYDRDFDINPYSYALNTSRAMVPYDENGNLEYYTMNYAPFNILNELENNSISLNMVDLKAQVDLNWNIFKFLRWDFTGAMRYVKSEREHEIKENSNMAEAYRAAGNSTIREKNKFLYKDPDNPNAEPIVVLPYGGFYNRDEDHLVSYDFRNSLSFSKEFGRHSINALVGQQVKYADRQEYNMTGYGYQYEQGGIPFVDYKILKQMIESNFNYYGMGETRDRFAAFYANADYSFDERYVISGTVRYDGSNGLGKSRSARWLPTWNVSAKWNTKEEKFLQNQDWLDYLSLRASYGLTASIPPAANASAVFYNESTNRPYMSEIESVIVLSSLENSELTWEKGYLMNFGLDFSIFKRRFDLTVDFWKRNSFDLISVFRTSGIGGEVNKLANYADMSSHGVDLGMGIIPVRAGDFEWKMNITYGLSKNTITNAKNRPSIFDVVNPNGGNVEGYPVRSLFSIVYKGLDPETGIPSFVDHTGNISNNVYMQSTNIDNLKYEGSVEPTYVGGISNNFTYKNLTLNVFFTFQGGNVIRLNPVFKTRYSDLDAMPNAFYDRWTMTGDEKVTNVPSIVDAYVESTQLSGVYPYNAYNYSTERVAKGDFMRLKNVSITYSLPSDVLRKMKVFSKMSFTLAASNLCLLYSDKKLCGQDPEFFNTGGVAQPIQKQITLALNIGF